MFWSILLLSLVEFPSTGAHTVNDVRVCGNNTCLNNALCTDDGLFCQCRHGYRGDTCQDDFDECSIGIPCYHRGYCNNTYGSYTCDCLKGWANGNGISQHCRVKVTSHNRLCMPGWMGELCHDQCLNSAMCEENQICIKRGRGMRCVCELGWEGDNCTTDVDECMKNPCKSYEACVNTNGSFTCTCPAGWQGANCSDDMNECLRNPCNHSGVCINTGGSYLCNCTDGWTGNHCDEGNETINTTAGYSHIPTFPVTQILTATVQHYHLEDAVKAKCTSNGWNISLDMNILQLLYSGITEKDIYLSTAKCKGTLHGDTLWFQKSFNSCQTTGTDITGTKVFHNVLFYATFDSSDPAIVLRNFWTYNIACYVASGETISSHLHHEVENHSMNITGHHDIALTFFRDQNFLHQIPEGPLKVTVGDNIYVKVTTSIPDWNTKMRLHTCYTRSSDSNVNEHALIHDGCEVDKSTHIISQSTHETKFVCRDFGYLTLNEGLDIYCNATFCASSDYSPTCTQACRQNPPIVG